MPEKVKGCAEKAADMLNSVSPSKREMAFVVAETFAAGIAIGTELTASKQEAKDGKE